MKTKSKRTQVVKHLIALKDAHSAITEIWEEEGSLSELDDILSDEYPYDVSFTDLNLNVSDWVDNAIEQLKFTEEYIKSEDDDRWIYIRYNLNGNIIGLNFMQGIDEYNEFVNKFTTPDKELTKFYEKVSNIIDFTTINEFIRMYVATSYRFGNGEDVGLNRNILILALETLLEQLVDGRTEDMDNKGKIANVENQLVLIKSYIK